MVRNLGIVAAAFALWCVGATPVQAQSLGTFRWQLQPYCNVVSVTVTQLGSYYTLDGYDDQCGASTRASIVGSAFQNPSGTIGIGFSIVTTPGGVPVAVDATVDLATVSGTWRDSAGHMGTFTFTPGSGTGGSPRPAALSGIPDNAVTSLKIADGAVGASDIDSTQVQRRLTSSCPSGELMTGVTEGGAVVCSAVTSGAGGDITAVNAGTGLSGGGATGDVTLNVAFSQSGTAATAARSDHTHDVGGNSNTRVGDGALPTVAGAGANTALGGSALAANTSGSANTAVGSSTLRDNVSGLRNTAIGNNAGRNVTSSNNTLVGWAAGQVTSTGRDNTFIGQRAGFVNTTGSSNTLLGSGAELASNNLTNAAAIGALAEVAASNALVLGRINGVNGGTSDTNVGIGTSSPQSPLDIDATLNSLPSLRITNTGGPALVNTRVARGTRSAPAATQQNDVLFEVRANGHSGTDFTTGGRGNILVRATEDWTTTANGAAMDFFSTPNGTAAPLQRMIITNDGDVAIGRTNAAQLLDVNGNVRVGTGITGCVEDRDGTLIAGMCSSDARLKRDIASFPDMLGMVARLRPVTYFWRSEEFPDRHFGASQSYGLIAQEVEALIPDMVTTDAQGYKAVNYSKLPLLTLQAVKELVAENDTLKGEVRDQKGDVAALRAELAAMRTLVEQLVTAQR